MAGVFRLADEASTDTTKTINARIRPSPARLRASSSQVLDQMCGCG